MSMHKLTAGPPTVRHVSRLMAYCLQLIASDPRGARSHPRRTWLTGAPPPEFRRTRGPSSSSTSPNVLSGQPDAEDGPADVLDRYEDVTASPGLRRGLDDLQAVTLPDDPHSDVDGGPGRDLSSARRDGPSVEDRLLVVLVDVRAQDLLATQVRTEVLLYIEQVYECTRPDEQSPGCRRAVAGTSIDASGTGLARASC